MRNTIWMMFLLGMLLAPTARSEEFRPRYPVQPVAAPPAIDGKLDDACWAALPEMGLFLNKRGQVAPVQTQARMGYADGIFFLAARLDEPHMDRIKADIKKSDDGVWQDDDIEIFLSPKDSAEPYYVFRINSIGVREEGHMTDDAKLWSVPWQGAVQKDTKGWTVEFAVPLKGIKPDGFAPWDVWRANVCRYRAHVSSNDLEALSSWSGLQGGAFHNPSAFGELIFLPAPALREIRVETAPAPTGGTLRITAAGTAATYRLWGRWFVDGADPENQYGGVAVPATGPGTAELRFQKDGESCSAQVCLIEWDAPTRHLYRSDWLAVKSVDPLQARLNRLRETWARVRVLPAAPAPAFAALAAGWAPRVAQVVADPQDAAVRTLLQELRAREWFETLPAPERARPVAWAPVVAFTPLDYDHLPPSAAVGGAVRIRAIRGEYEPGCVNLLPLQADAALLPVMEDLRTDAGTLLPAAVVDIRWMKNWYQAGRGANRDADGKGVWVPELLVKDDTMVESDHVKQRNRIVHRRDGPDLKPVTIPRFFTRQLWLTVHVPTNQAPGLYRGALRVDSAGQAAARVPVEVEVLPLTVEPTDFTFTMYYYGKLTGGKDPKADAVCEADMKMAAEHGLTAMMIKEGAEEKWVSYQNRYLAAYDCALIRQAFELRRKHGLTGHTVITSAMWDTPSASLTYYNLDDLEKLPFLKAYWAELARGADAVGRELGFTHTYTYCLDEPGYDPTGKMLERERLICGWTREVGVKTVSAITENGAAAVKEVLDLPILDSPTARVGDHRKSWPYPQTWLYWHPREDPLYDRLFNGLIVWYSGYTGTAPWMYQVQEGEASWDDWGWTATPHRQMGYVVEAEAGPVPLIAYEGFREGADDVRLLEMLARRVKALKARAGLPAAAMAAVTKAEIWLDAPPEKYRGTVNDLTRRLTPMDMQAFRSATLDLLLELEKVP